MKHYLIIMIVALQMQANTTMIDNINKTLKALEYETTHTSHALPRIKYDPFYHDKPKHVAKKVSTKSGTIMIKKKGLILSMVFNKRAFINGKWYKENDKVAQYVLSQVSQDSVVLRQKHKNIVLNLAKNDNLLVKTEVQ